MPCPQVTEGYRQGLLATVHKKRCNVLPRIAIQLSKRIRGGHSMRFEASDSHHNRLAANSARHVLVPRDELEYAMCQVYSIGEAESREILCVGISTWLVCQWQRGIYYDDTTSSAVSRGASSMDATDTTFLFRRLGYSVSTRSVIVTMVIARTATAT